MTEPKTPATVTEEHLRWARTLIDGCYWTPPEIAKAFAQERADRDAKHAEEVTRLKEALRVIGMNMCPASDGGGLDCAENEQLCVTEWCAGCIAREALA